MKLFLLLIGFAGFGFTTYMAINPQKDIYQLDWNLAGYVGTAYFKGNCAATKTDLKGTCFVGAPGKATLIRVTSLSYPDELITIKNLSH